MDDETKYNHRDPKLDNIYHESFLEKLQVDKKVLKKTVTRIEGIELLYSNIAVSPISRREPSINTWHHPHFFDFFTNADWQADLRTEVEKIALKYSREDFKHLVKKSKKGKKARKLNRILIIQQQIKILAAEISEHFDYSLVCQVRRLAQELHALLSFYYTKQKRYLYFLKLSRSNFNHVIRDLRLHFRNTVRLIFKDLPDFSGSEEEEVKLSTVTNGQLLFLTSQTRKNVQHSVFNKRFR